MAQCICPHQAAEARLNNVSKGGVHLTSEKPMIAGDAVECEVMMHNAYMNLIFIGEVVWTSKVGEGHFESGIVFTRIEYGDKQRLLDSAYNMPVL